MSRPERADLERRLGTADAVVVGLGAMVGAGVFAVLAPAAQAAGSLLLAGMAVAGVVATCNGLSSAALAAVHPESGGTYVHGRRRLGPVWGGARRHRLRRRQDGELRSPGPDRGRLRGAVRRPAGGRAGGAGTGRGEPARHRLHRTPRTRPAGRGARRPAARGGRGAGRRRPRPGGADGAGRRRSARRPAVGGAAAFAFAGYARIATLGGEVRDPARTIPRAVRTALAVALVVHLLVAVSALLAVGAPALAGSSAHLSTVVEATAWSGAEPVVRAGGAVAALGVLLSLLAGVSRTAFAMAREGDLPRGLDAVSPRTRVPYRAELAVAVAVVALVLVVDLRGAVGVSSFAVLGYDAVTNAAALVLRRQERRLPRWVPVVGLVGCVVLALTLPLGSVVAGSAVLALGALLHLARRTRQGRPGGRP